MPTEHTSQEHQHWHIHGPATPAGPRRDHRATHGTPTNHTQQSTTPGHPTATTPGLPVVYDHPLVARPHTDHPPNSRDHTPNTQTIRAPTPPVRATINHQTPHCSPRPHPSFNGLPPRKPPDAIHPTQFATHQPPHPFPDTHNSPNTATPPIPRAIPSIPPRCFRYRHQPPNRTGDKGTHRDQPTQHPTF